MTPDKTGAEADTAGAAIRIPMSSFRTVPLADLTDPKDGRIVYADRWWVVTRDDQALFYVGERRRYNSPQCNHDRRVVEHSLGTKPEGCRVMHIPLAFLRHDCHDYV